MNEVQILEVLVEKALLSMPSLCLSAVICALIRRRLLLIPSRFSNNPHIIIHPPSPYGCHISIDTRRLGLSRRHHHILHLNHIAINILKYRTLHDESLLDICRLPLLMGRSLHRKLGKILPIEQENSSRHRRRHLITDRRSSNRHRT
jgi:hypothetical protein